MAADVRDSIAQWSATEGSNLPQGSTTVGTNMDDNLRMVQAVVRKQAQDDPWLDWGHAPTFLTSTSFSVPGNLTALYEVNRRVRLFGSTMGTLTGSVTASTFSTVTTVTVALDSGILTANLSQVLLSKVTPNAMPGNAANDALLVHKAGAETITGPKTFSAQPIGITAASIVNVPAGSVASTNIQAAIAELETDIQTKAPLASPAFTGVPVAPTASLGTNTTQLSTTAFVQAAVAASVNSAITTSFTPVSGLSATNVQAMGEELNAEKAPLNSPTFTGTPSVPTAAVGTNTTQAASTAFVLGNSVNLTGSQTIPGAKTFTANPSVSAVAPFYLLVETDQASPSGRWAIGGSNGNLLLARNTAVAGDFSTLVSSLVITQGDVATFNGRVAGANAVQPSDYFTKLQIENKFFAGAVAVFGTSAGLPTGWTSVQNGDSTYTVTHNLGTTNYAVVPIAQINGTNLGYCQVSRNTNNFVVSIRGHNLDNGTFPNTIISQGFNFILQLF